MFQCFVIQLAYQYVWLSFAVFLADLIPKPKICQGLSRRVFFRQLALWMHFSITSNLLLPYNLGWLQLCTLLVCRSFLQLALASTLALNPDSSPSTRQARSKHTFVTIALWTWVSFLKSILSSLRLQSRLASSRVGIQGTTFLLVGHNCFKDCFVSLCTMLLGRSFSSTRFCPQPWP